LYDFGVATLKVSRNFRFLFYSQTKDLRGKYIKKDLINLGGNPNIPKKCRKELPQAIIGTPLALTIMNTISDVRRRQKHLQVPTGTNPKSILFSPLPLFK